MANVLVMKNDQGKLEGFGQRGAKAYNRFLGDVRALATGELLTFSYKVPRSTKFHNRHFVMLATVYEAQEKFVDEHAFRKWSEVGGGYCDMVPGAKGELVAVPKSIDYDTLDDLEFEPVHRAVKDFLRSDHCTAFLWRHLGAQQQWEMIEQLLMGFD